MAKCFSVARAISWFEKRTSSRSLLNLCQQHNDNRITTLFDDGDLNARVSDKRSGRT
jgi:hypothetical protein